MTKRKLACIWPLRNVVADKAGQYIPCKGKQRYMKPVLESSMEALNQTALSDAYEPVGVIYDDNAELSCDQGKTKDYGFAYRPGQQWLCSTNLQAQDKALNGLLLSVSFAYRRYPWGTSERVADKSDFERRLHDTLVGLGADVAVSDGLLVILDEPVHPGVPFVRQVMNIHPGVTRGDSPYERRNVYTILDALYETRGEKVVDQATTEKVTAEPLYWAGASFHCVDNDINSDEAFHDVLKVEVSSDGTILELRWNNFSNSLFLALHGGSALLTEKL